MGDWSQIATVGAFVVTVSSIIYGFGRTNGKLDSHALETRRRFDDQDRVLTQHNQTLTGVDRRVAKIEGKLDMNGHG